LAPSGMIVLTMVSLFLLTIIVKNMKFRLNNIVMMGNKQTNQSQLSP
jgi:hypothetical protein